jgi:hypothetical protein
VIATRSAADVLRDTSSGARPSLSREAERESTKTSLLSGLWTAFGQTGRYPLASICQWRVRMRIRIGNADRVCLASYTLRSHSVSSLTNIQATSSIAKAWNASRQTPNDYNACSIQYYIQLGSDYPCLNYTFACQQAICGTFDTFLLVLFDDLLARRLTKYTTAADVSRVQTGV